MVLFPFSLGSNTAFNPSTIVPTYGAGTAGPSTIQWSYRAGGAPRCGIFDRRGPDSGTYAMILADKFAPVK